MLLSPRLSFHGGRDDTLSSRAGDWDPRGMGELSDSRSVAKSRLWGGGSCCLHRGHVHWKEDVLEKGRGADAGVRLATAPSSAWECETTKGVAPGGRRQHSVALSGGREHRASEPTRPAPLPPPQPRSPEGPQTRTPLQSASGCRAPRLGTGSGGFSEDPPEGARMLLSSQGAESRA